MLFWSFEDEDEDENEPVFKAGKDSFKLHPKRNPSLSTSGAKVSNRPINSAADQWQCSEIIGGIQNPRSRIPCISRF